MEFVAESILRCSLVVDDGTDPDFSYVVLLLGFEGINGSQGAPGFTDESSKHHGTATFGGSPHIDTAQFKFGTSSLRVPAVSSAVVFNDSADWILASSNSDQYTVECWVRFNVITATTNILISQQYGSTNYSWSLETSGLTEFAFKCSHDGSTVTSIVSTGAALTTGIWYHLAVDKDLTGKIRIYKNGIPMGNATPANSSIFNGPFSLTIGNEGFYAGLYMMDGWLDEIRITKGKARYHTDASFTPPTAAFPRAGSL